MDDESEQREDGADAEEPARLASEGELRVQRNWWLLAAGALSIAYAVAIVLVVANAGRCDGVAAGAGWWQVLFACRPVNEIGDFLAGAFAPLAFLWLAAAVFIQAQELAAQRKELQLTRREFELNRVVAEETRREIAAQAAAARESARYVGLQTNILKDQFEREKSAAADENFSALLDQLETLIRHRFMQVTGRSTSTGANKRIFHLLAADLPASRDSCLALLSSTMISAVKEHRANIQSGEILIHEGARKAAIEVHLLLAAAFFKLKSVSESPKFLAQTLNLQRWMEAVDELTREPA